VGRTQGGAPKPTGNLQKTKDKYTDQIGLLEYIMKGMLQKKHGNDWQTARAANDRHVTGSHVQNAVLF